MIVMESECYFSHGEVLMNCWEDIAVDKEKQKQIRLELFPMAMFPESHGGVGRRREDLESSVTGPDEAS